MGSSTKRFSNFWYFIKTGYSDVHVVHYIGGPLVELATDVIPVCLKTNIILWVWDFSYLIARQRRAKLWLLLNEGYNCYNYRLPTKLREGNVFSHVCPSMSYSVNLDLIVQGPHSPPPPPPRPPEMFKLVQNRPLCTGRSLPEIFKLDLYESRTAGKRAVGFQQKCLIVFSKYRLPAVYSKQFLHGIFGRINDVLFHCWLFNLWFDSLFNLFTEYWILYLSVWIIRIFNKGCQLKKYIEVV